MKQATPSAPTDPLFIVGTNPAPPTIAQNTTAQPTTVFHGFSYLLGLLTALVLVGGSTLLLRRVDPPPIVLHPPPTAAPTATPLPTATAAPIIVFVSGAVVRTGIYSLSPTARVADAITAAGGVTGEANAAIVNQAEPLWDGAQVHVPSLATTANIAPEPPTGVSGVAADSAPAGEQSSGVSAGLINLNTATATDLESLPGIGPSKAAAIIANRPYTTVDDLERAPGIGARTLEQLRPLVTVQ
ncbi:MAG: ComEA family DNA-binding protein [Caldilinea sp. CFX5]|nr:ComEA family DNA-binding protein [Caldilinea sp. CFX5]